MRYITTSRQIAQVIGKPHTDVLFDIQYLLEELHGADEGVPGVSVERDYMGLVAAYRLDKKYALTLATGYCPDWSQRIFRHLHDLEKAAKLRIPAAERLQMAEDYLLAEEIFRQHEAEKGGAA